jgi:butyryl-CoA dehydrogenase
MDLDFTDEQRRLREAFARFADERIRPQAEAIDRAGQFPRALFTELATLGFFGLRYPEANGGSGLGFLEYCLAISEIARGSLSLAACAAMQSLMGTHFIQALAGPALQQRYLVPALAGELVCTICITEPNAGSDLAAIATRAERDGEGYRLHGQKTWITLAPQAGVFTVFARAGADQALTIFLVDRDDPGLVVGRAIDKLGACGAPTAEVSFADCYVPLERRLGAEGQGEAELRQLLARIRVMTGALALGIGRAALDDACRYAAQRVQFGKPIAQHQAIALKLADMATAHAAATQLVYRAAWLLDQGRPHATEAAMAKLHASESAVMICDECCRILGAYGYAMEYAAQRYWRDARFTLIGGGTSEILKWIIAGQVVRACAGGGGTA